MLQHVLLHRRRQAQVFQRCNVVRVGDEMAEVLGEAGISVLHDRTLYDYPSCRGYVKSISGVPPLPEPPRRAPAARKQTGRALWNC